MNEVVAKFIEEQKQKRLEEIQKKKQEHIRSLGLVDNQKVIPTREYFYGMGSDAYLKNNGYCQDEKGWYKIVNKPAPLEVTDEDYEELCKICPPNHFENKELETKIKSNSFAEKTATITSYCFFVVGIIAFIVFLSLAIDDEEWFWFGIGAGTLLTSLSTGALSLVLVNISRKLDRLN